MRYDGCAAPSSSSCLQQPLLHPPAMSALLPPSPNSPHVVLDSGERRLNELGYKQELRREMTLFKTLAICFSTMTLFTGITPLYGSSLAYAGPVGVVWGWVIVTFFTWFVGVAMSEICSSFPHGVKLKKIGLLARIIAVLIAI